MERVMGLLRVRVVRGLNLVARDAGGSDAYVVATMGAQKLKTSVKKNNLNPEWNEDLTLSVEDPSQPIRLIDTTSCSCCERVVFDKDTFTRDDEMGDAEFSIQPLAEAANMKLEGTANGTIIEAITPSRENCLAKDSFIVVKDGFVSQQLSLRLRNVESGEVELQLQWVNIPSTADF